MPAPFTQARRQKPLDITAESLEEFIRHRLMILILVKLLLSGCSFHNITRQGQGVFSPALAVHLDAR